MTVPTPIDDAFEGEVRATARAMRTGELPPKNAPYRGRVAELAALHWGEKAPRKTRHPEPNRQPMTTEYTGPVIPFAERKSFSYLSMTPAERLKAAQERWDALTPEEQARERNKQQNETLAAVRWLKRHGEHP